MNDIGLAQVEARHGSRQGHCELDQITIPQQASSKCTHNSDHHDEHAEDYPGESRELHLRCVVMSEQAVISDQFQKRSDRLRQLPVNSDRFRLLSDRYRHFPMDSDCFPTDSDNLRSTPTLCESFRGLPIMQFHAQHNWERFGAIPTCFRSIPALSDPFRPFSDRFRHFPINSDCFPISFEAFRGIIIVDNGLQVGSVEPGWSGPTYFVAIWMLHTGCCSKQHSDVSALSFRHFP